MSFEEDYKKSDAVGLAKLIKTKQVSSNEVLETAIKLIEKLDPKINSIHLKLFDFAKESLKKNKNKFFYGVPIFLKDLDASLKGFPMMQGSNFLKENNMSYNSNITKKIISTGSIICGKSATPEFGLMVTTEPKAFLPTKNPWDLKCTSGGSSGGSAASVASRMVPIAHANDGGGSIRIPSASCGTLGLKPTRGRISCSPMDGDRWSGFSTSGIISRTVRDTAYMYNDIFGNAVGDPYYSIYKKGSLVKSLSKKSKFKIGFSTKFQLPVKVSDETKKAVIFNANICESLGHSVEEIDLKYDSFLLARAFIIIISSHVSEMIEELKLLKGRDYKFNEIENSSLVLDYLGREFTGLDYAWARQTVQKIARDVMIQMDNYDSVILPILSEPPVLLGSITPTKLVEVRNDLLRFLKLGWLFKWKLTRDRILNKLIPQNFWYAPDVLLQNITGQPALSIPTYWTEKGLPMGVQFVSRFSDEYTLIDIASQIEEAHPWDHRIPKI